VRHKSIEHLHDRCPLSSVIPENKQLFVDTTLSWFKEEPRSAKWRTNSSINKSMEAACQEHRNDAEYKGEYVRFVDAMSYADDAGSISLNVTLENFDRQISFFTSAYFGD
jgi:hypothetical protein